jgi:SAM-dependent methyltransferase
MRGPWKRLDGGLRTAGLDVGRILRTIAGVPRFIYSTLTYRRLARDGRFPVRLASLRPMVLDAGDAAGVAAGEYFHQDLWAARKISARRPSRHVDVASRVDGFVAHVLTFMPVEVVDIRPLKSKVDGLTFVQADATEMSGFASDSLESVSSLHALEHFGLGRYGDPVDPDACFRAMRSLARVLAAGGHLYVSVPVGRERVEFNAQRVFAPETVVKGFAGLELLSFRLIDGAGDLGPEMASVPSASGAKGCGLFEFTKR